LYKPLVQAVPRIEKRVISAIFKKYLQCVLAARILTVDFVVCTLAVEKKKIRAGFDMLDRTIPLLVGQVLCVGYVSSVIPSWGLNV
jgi:hypothetical protein